MIRQLMLGSLLLVCLLAQPQFNSSAQPETLVSVCAANYSRNYIAFDSIVAAFGAQLASAIVVAGDADPQTPGIQLPTVLGGVSVRVAGKLAPLFFVSPGQINYLVPPGLRVEDLNNNFATVEVVNDGNVVASGRALIHRVAPAFFTFDSSGSGLPAALIVRVKPDDSQIIEALGETTGTPRGLRARLVDVSPADERVFLVVYLSGVRNATDANRDDNVNENIRVLLNGYEVELYYAGAQRELAGLDQINVQIPRAFYGAAKLQLTVQWKEKAGVEVATEVPLATPPVTNLNWTAQGLNQSAINCLAAGELTLLAGTTTGTFRSEDQGQSWELSFSRGSTLSLLHVGGGTFRTGTAGNGPWISRDLGIHWEVEMPGSGIPDFLTLMLRVYALADFGGSYLGTDRGLLEMQGKTWGVADQALAGSGATLTLLKNFNRTYAGTSIGGVFTGSINQSIQRARSWLPSNQGLPANAKVSALASSAHYIFAIVNDNMLYRSSDNGASWERLTNGLPNSVPFTALASHGRNIFAGTQGNGAYLSTDFGANWSAANNGLTNLNVLSFLVDGTRLYVGTAAGLFITDSALPPSKLPTPRQQQVSTVEDTPKAITLAEANLPAGNVSYSIATAPQNGVLSGTPPNVTYTPRADFNGYDSFSFRTSDGVLSSPPARVDIFISPINDAPKLEIKGKTNVLAGEVAYLEIFATDAEEGTTKVAVANLPTNALLTQGISALDPHRFRWTAGAPGTYSFTFTATDNDPQPLSTTQTVTFTVRENSERTSWVAVKPAEYFAVAALFAEASGVYATFRSDISTPPVQQTILRSLDNGQSWTPYSNGFPVSYRAQRFAAGSNYIYAGTSDGVWRTANTTANWTEVTNTLTSASKSIDDLTVSGDKVAVTTSSGCYLSLNRGENWAAIRACLKVAFSGNTLFVHAVRREGGIGGSVISEGLFFSADNGATWTEANQVLGAFKYITRLQGNDASLCVFSNDLNGNERIFCTLDRGQSWKTFDLALLANTNFSTFFRETLTSIAISGNTIVVGTNPFGVYVSRDGGTSWRPANLGLPQPLNIRDVWLRGEYLFASHVRFDAPYDGNVFVRKLANE